MPPSPVRTTPERRCTYEPCSCAVQAPPGRPAFLFRALPASLVGVTVGEGQGASVLPLRSAPRSQEITRPTRDAIRLEERLLYTHFPLSAVPQD